MLKIYLLARKIVSAILPESAYRVLSLPFHYTMTFIGAMYFGFPSRHLTVIGVTGTNGKSTVVEMIHKILEEAGMCVASVSSIRTNICGQQERNTQKMTMGGRMFLQNFLRKSVAGGAEIVVLEITSEGIRQFRNKFIHFDVAVLTNITPEHIESHGSFERYVQTKKRLFKIAKQHVLNKDDASFPEFQKLTSEKVLVYGAGDIAKEQLQISLPGDFNKMNALAALNVARLFSIKDEVSKKALLGIKNVPGRFEIVNTSPRIIVDYAHTPDALEKVYAAAREDSKGRLVCVLGSTGGGRDKWKRPEHGRIASSMCDQVIFTNEDPYNEDPEQIINEVASGASEPYEIILDRKEAIESAVNSAQKEDTILITGKGSEMVMAVAGGKLVPWSDQEAVKEILAERQKS